ncbi:MAG TPA: hypothetical protein VEB66_03770 [Opitutaceae bacterium]|nr:hypothetical protein [Opitutaceae bacterium]
MILAVGGSLFLAGCASEPEAHVVTTPPPQVIVQQQPAAIIGATPVATSNGTIVVTQAPPAAPQDVVVTRPSRPSSEHVWVDGHWTIRNGRYEWVNAGWQRPPYSGARWVAPSWERRSDGSYVFYEAYWN